MAKHGYAYAGDCRTSRLEADVGKYCSLLFERQAGRRVYGIGLAFSEGTTYLLLTQSSGRWRVTPAAKKTGLLRRRGDGTVRTAAVTVTLGSLVAHHRPSRPVVDTT